jgi:hypothetical protein
MDSRSEASDKKSSRSPCSRCTSSAYSPSRTLYSWHSNLTSRRRPPPPPGEASRG